MLSGIYVVPLMFPPPETIDQVPPTGVAVNVLVCPSVIEAEEVVLSATTSHTGVTVKEIVSEVEAHEPSASIVYLISTVVLVLISVGVYTLLLIEPPPEMIEKVPPAGEPVKVLFWFSVIEVVVVVLSAITQIGVTVKVTSSEVATQVPFAGIVYLIFTVVFVLILLGVYTFPLIDPPPEMIDQVPPFGVAVNVFVSPSLIVAVEVVFFTTISAGSIIVKSAPKSIG